MSCTGQDIAACRRTQSLGDRKGSWVIQYVNRPVTLAKLNTLYSLATADEAAFIIRNPHLVSVYRNRLLAVALCQGAALQYLGCGYGSDFDLHFICTQIPEKPRLSRAVKRIWATLGSFGNVAVDYIRTVVPDQFASSPPVTERIRQF